MTRIDRVTALANMADEIRTCTACRLHSTRTNTVPGSGNPYAQIVFVGEAPGKNEDEQGLPFVGQSGKLLDKLLGTIGLTRADVFIANVVKDRPPDNRDPLPDELIACKHFLDRQLEVLDPLVIATLGRFSMARYFPDAKITKIHGQPKYDERRAYYPLFHPAAILRNPAQMPDMEADFKRLPEVLEKVKEMRAALDAAPKPDDPPVSGTQMPLF
jgi:uracil-DNA glycosylase